MTSRSFCSFLSVALAALLVAQLAACAGSKGPAGDSGLEGLALDSLNPGTVVPGTTIVLGGASFVSAEWGTSWVRFSGTFGGSDVDALVTAKYVDFTTMTVDADSDLFSQLGGSDGDFEGEVSIEVQSAVDGELYTSQALFVQLSFRTELTPSLDTVQDSGLIFVNDELVISGGGLLLGGDEGTTYAVIEGCFIPEGQTLCTDIGPIESPVIPSSPFDRTRGAFAFGPEIAGINPGSFDGTVHLRNDLGQGRNPTSSMKNVAYDLIPPTVFSVSTTSASLGQYMDVEGGGFVGGSPSALTLLRLVGTYTPTGAPGGAPVDLLLVPEFVAGRTVRYVINEDDSLGQALDLRKDTGTFTGTVTPITRYMGAEVTGDGATMSLSIAPVKQVVYLDFKDSYVESLRTFGLRAVDSLIRDRVVAVVRRDFAGINVDVRTELPQDFALYSHVDIAGPDPNGLGLFGYDNTPGKDTDNERLYDRIGGANATTQEDGYPGFGGVFIESMLGFSTDPGSTTEPIMGGSENFDAVFDPFRADRGGERIAAKDLSGGVAVLTNGDACPASDRSEQVACAVFVLGSMVGGTISHEIGHSLGLANPYSEGFHNSGDGLNRLMDGGSDRPFLERAELFGEGPSRFCQESYEYLRQILPTNEPSDAASRPSCL